MGSGARDIKPSLDRAKTPEEVRDAILSYLRGHRHWYAWWSKFYTVAWNTTTLLIVIFGAVTSILAALGTRLPEFYQPLIIVLPAISSLLGAILIQFRLKEMCRLREMGRLACENLICDAHLLVPVDGRDHEVFAAAIRLRKTAHQVEPGS